jgi:putative ATP-dependent endonuclease of OLD family
MRSNESSISKICCKQLAQMQIRHIRVENFRGIKKLDWHVSSNPVCIIGKGDSCKSTLLDALELGLSPSATVNIDDSDFFDMDVAKPVSIQISVGAFDKSKDLERLLLSETNYGLFVRGYKDKQIVDEPDDDDERILTVEFWVDEELEPQWRVIAPGRHDPKYIKKAHLEKFGTAKLGSYADWHFTWSKNSMISRLLGKDVREINSALATIGRKARTEKIDLKTFEAQAKELEEVVRDFGVHVSDYTPKLDIQALAVKSGGLSLHDGDVPIKRYGTGTKRLIALALQKKLNEGKSIRLVDEIEYGLEPYRITQVMKKIHSGDGQTFITTHSPTVLREATIENIVVFHAKDGNVEAVQLGENLSDDAKGAMQGTLRTHAESFLSERIIVCEGATEIGLSRALNTYRGSKSQEVFSAQGIALLDAGGSSKCAPVAEKLRSAGYSVSIFCDSDVALTTSDTELSEQGININKWSGSRCTEQAIFEDLPVVVVIKCVDLAISIKNAVDVRSLIMGQGLTSLHQDISQWDWSDAEFRSKVGKAASNGSWFKNIRHAEELGNLLLSNIDDASNDSDFKTVFLGLSEWCN